MVPDSPGIGESGAAITGSESVEGSTGGVAEVTAGPHMSPEAITAMYDGEPRSGKGSYQLFATVYVLSQCGIRRKLPQDKLYETKSPRSGRDQSRRSDRSSMASAPAGSMVVQSKMAATLTVQMSFKSRGDNRESKPRSPGSFSFRLAK